MLRCAHCRGHAHPALAWLHGLLEHLCYSCTQRVTKNKKETKRVDNSIDPYEGWADSQEAA